MAYGLSGPSLLPLVGNAEMSQISVESLSPGGGPGYSQVVNLWAHSALLLYRKEGKLAYQKPDQIWRGETSKRMA